MKCHLTTILLLWIGLNSAATQSLNIPLITVTETEVAFAEVDEIHFSIVIRSYAKEIQDARNKNRKIAESVFTYLEEKNIPKQYIQTKRMQISRNYLRNRSQGEYDGFNAFQEIYVCLKDLEIYDEIVDSLLVMDIASINGPDFKSSKYEETLKEARLEALKKARISAETMATALKQSIGKAKLITTQISNNTSNFSYSTQSAANSDFTSSRSSFEVGEITIRAVVEVAFELLEE